MRLSSIECEIACENRIQISSGENIDLIRK